MLDRKLRDDQRAILMPNDEPQLNKTWTILGFPSPEILAFQLLDS